MQHLLWFVVAICYYSHLEYCVHRYPMHHRIRWLHQAFERHTLHHHVERSWKTFWVPAGQKVLTDGSFMPKIYLMHAPMFLLIGWRCGWINVVVFMLTALLCLVAYEVFHEVQHTTPPEQPLGTWQHTVVWLKRQRFFQFLERHHYIHHKQQWSNYNVVLPLCDLLYGTLNLKNRQRVTPQWRHVINYYRGQ